MLFQGYIDDSGSNRGKFGGDIFVLAGFLAPAQNWQAFTADWNALSDQEPKTLDFHMAKAYRMSGHYPWKNEAERDAKINQFVDLIKAHAMYRVDSLLAWPNYDAIIKGQVPPEIDSPYFLLFLNIVLSMASFMDKAGIDGVVDWVFDEQGKIGQTALKWYEYIKVTSPEIGRRIGNSPTFKHDSDAIPLKAADVYAWQIRRHLDTEAPAGIPHNDHIETLLGIHGVSNKIDGEHMEDFIRNIGHGLMLKSQTQYFLPGPGAPLILAGDG